MEVFSMEILVLLNMKVDIIKNKWFGFGRLYDKKNELTYEGEWCNDNPMGKKSERIEGKLKEEDIHLSLEEIMINGCFDNIERFWLIGDWEWWFEENDIF